MTSGNRPAPEQGSWHVPGAASPYPPSDEPSGRARHRGRPGVVASVVALTELVIIAAACNQAVTKHARQYAADHPGFLGHAVASSLQFAWRITPRAGDNRGGSHVYASQLTTIGVLVVLSALLSVVVTRGAVTFWRAFFGVWTAVLAAACIGCAVGSLVTEPPSGAGRATNAVFLSITGETVFSGVVLGLVAAVIGAVFAVSTRRSVEVAATPAPPPEPAHVPESPPPFYGHAEQRDGADDSTTQLPRVDPPRDPQSDR